MIIRECFYHDVSLGDLIMDVEIAPTRKINVMGLDNRSKDNIAWCAASFGATRLYWIDGYLLCLEVYDKSFEEEIKKKEFPISQVCYVKSPKYEKLYEIDKSFQIPVVNVSDMKLYKAILKAILEKEKSDAAPSC
jgi:hypothetical protein